MSSMIQFAEVVAAAEAAVSERGADYVYKHPYDEFGTCSNVHVKYDEDGSIIRDGEAEPGCVVGTLAIRMFDINPNDLVVVDIIDAGADAFMAYVLGEHATERVGISEKAQAFLRAIQSAQDRGVPWGIALANAKAGFTTYSANVSREYLDSDIAKARIEDGTLIVGKDLGLDQFKTYQRSQTGFADYSDEVPARLEDYGL